MGGGKISCKINEEQGEYCNNQPKEKLLNKAFEYKRCPAEAPTCVKHSNEASICMEACPEGQTRCHGSCIDPKSNSKFCGAKGNCTAENQDDPNYQGQKCLGGQSCQDGSCQCPAGQVFCDKEGKKTCIDPQSNPQFCGAKGDCTAEKQNNPNYKGQACPETQSCQNGSCQCPRGQAFCEAEGKKTCIDPQSNPHFCGAKGACDVPNDEKDPNYKGQECLGGQSCQGGSCRCPSKQAFCDEACIDPQSNPHFCGAKGACDVPNDEKDPNYKGRVCGDTTPLCNQGQCSDLCADGRTNCDGHCVDLQSDPQNCGSCKKTCYFKNVHEATCTKSTPNDKNPQCGIKQCASGFVDCDKQPDNGCEAKFAERVEKDGDGFKAGDIKHCGACGNHCKQSEMHATELSCKPTTHSCSYQNNGTNSGSCESKKDSNSRYYNLDGDDSNGCESLISIPISTTDNSLSFPEIGRECPDCGIGNKICIKYKLNIAHSRLRCLPINLNADSQCINLTINNKIKAYILVTKAETDLPSYTLSICPSRCNADQTACN